VVGLEDDQKVFQRYRAIRKRERQYVDWPDPLDSTMAPIADVAAAV
jgi:hypothetical protein